VKLLEIETARLRMRPYTMDDIDGLHRLWTTPEARKYLWDDIIISREQAASVVAESIELFGTHGFGQCAVFPKDHESLIGFCGFRLFGEPPEVEILYGLVPQCWGHGLATEAARAMLRFGFEQCGWQRVYAGADPPNAASIRVMERCGMRFGKRVEINGLEAVYYEVTREAFQPDGAPYTVRRA
jgi:ribosomal-protein-alanine N-acetyltransferase